MSDKPYKSLGIDLLASALREREEAVDTFIECSHRLERAKLSDADAGPKAFERLKAAAVNESLGRHLTGLNHAIAANETLLRDAELGLEAILHLLAMRAEAAASARVLDQTGATLETETPTRSSGPSAS